VLTRLYSFLFVLPYYKKIHRGRLPSKCRLSLTENEVPVAVLQQVVFSIFGITTWYPRLASNPSHLDHVATQLARNLSLVTINLSLLAILAWSPSARNLMVVCVMPNILDNPYLSTLVVALLRAIKAVRFWGCIRQA